MVLIFTQSNGGLEYHLPASFTRTRPALTYSHIGYDMAAADHPIASQLPKPSARPSIVGDPDDFRSLFYPQGGPTKLDDYLNEDRPQIGLHIISFTDKTLVTIYWPHTLMDAMGKRALLDAWTLMLNGRTDDIITPRGAGLDADPLADLGRNPTEPHKLSHRHMGMLGLVQYGLYNILDFFRTQENRMVCVPGPFVAKLREAALTEVETEEEKESGVDKPFLTQGDVLCAWWTRIAIAHLPRKSRRTVVLNIAIDLRPSLAGDLLVGDDARYVSNAIGFVNVLLPAKDIFDKSLGEVALEIRCAIVELRTRGQVETFCAMWRASYGKVPPFFGDPGMHMVTYSNWSKAKLFELDVSAAVVRPGEGNKRPGIPKYIQNNQFGLILPNAFPIIGEDADGNYWLSGYLNKGHWSNIEQQLTSF